jgi:exopolysaccharide biosynthesis polyprenyl glycosylphosphotransferase
MKQGIYKRNLLVPFFKILMDFFFVFTAVLFSFYFRFYSPFTTIIPVRDGFIPAVGNYILFAILLGAIFLFFFSINKSYRSRFFTYFSQDIPTIFKVSLISILTGISFAFFYREFSYSRIVFILVFLNTSVFLLIGRYLFHWIKTNYVRKGFNVLQIYLIGSPEKLPMVYTKLISDENFNLNIKGYLSSRRIHDLPLEYAGNFNNLTAIIKKNDFDAFLISMNHQEHQQIMQIIDSIEGKNIEIFYVPDILDILTSNINHLEIAGIPILQLKAFTLSGWQGFLKRGFDITISLFSLVMLSPLLVFIAVLIKTTSRGPVFYKQQRVTLDNKDFTMFKFRSMYVTDESREGLVDVVRNDPRVTLIGKILRRASLDELPQLINVLRGEMSLVGPRPERRYFVEENIKEIRRYSERHRVRTGITGWAQVNGLRQQNTSLEERIRYDLYYIENWSLWFDLKIIIMTILEVLRGEEAY